MWEKCCAVAMLFVLCCGFFSPAQAHSPYFGQSEKISRPDIGAIEFAVLYGDGIIFADPAQVVVFDSEGYLLAATSLSSAFVIRCDRSDAEPNCIAFDDLQGNVFEPDYENWAQGRIIEEEGRPPGDAYPELMDIEYGFIQRPATFIEKILFNAQSIVNAPIATLLSVLWWAVAWSFVTRLVWKWKRNGWQLIPAKGWSVVLSFMSVTAFLGMSFLAAYMWELHPYSSYFFSFVFILGALIAGMLTRTKAVVKAS